MRGFIVFTESRKDWIFYRSIFGVLNKNEIMEYKVIPFVATANQQNMRAKNIAEQLDNLIKVHTNNG
ncbi:hypothetical protein M2373_001710 [Chryseobacterium sp. JUb7]|nr:hypothetical protein [Chryseobacterium sp. JUb7]